MSFRESSISTLFREFRSECFYIWTMTCNKLELGVVFAVASLSNCVSCLICGIFFFFGRRLVLCLFLFGVLLSSCWVVVVRVGVACAGSGAVVVCESTF